MIKSVISSYQIVLIISLHQIGVFTLLFGESGLVIYIKFEKTHQNVTYLNSLLINVIILEVLKLSKQGTVSLVVTNRSNEF